MRERFSDTGEALMAQLRRQRVSHNTLVRVEAYLGAIMREHRAALSSPETTPAGVLDEAAERMIVTVRASHGPVRHYPCDICDRADALAAALPLQPAGVLDEAWEAAEKALPPDFHLELTGPLPGSGRWLAKSIPPFLPYEEWKLALREEFGPTPAAALHALAAALGRSGNGGGRG